MTMMISTHSGSALLAARLRRQNRSIVAQVVAAAAVGVLMFISEPAQAQFAQQGGKLFGTGATQPPEQGYSVGLSGDGNTAIMGGPTDAGVLGAAWIFTRNNGVWAQKGNKLVGTGFLGTPAQGIAVAMSGDGNTALVGGRNDDGGIGATWVFTLVNGVWTQQAELIANNPIGNPRQGSSLALSYDGNTAVVGGPYDNAQGGAAWVYTRSNGTWTQQGKLIGTAGSGFQGISVGVSGDGNTVIMGGNGGGIGQAWIFTRTNGVWTQQGNQLVGTGYVGSPFQGTSVALSGDGNTAIVGGYADNSNVGAAWIFTRSNGVWTQQGGKLFSAGAVGPALQGWSVSLSGDGNTAILGGYQDNGSVGATWVYRRSSGVWSQIGHKLVGTNATGVPQQGWAVALSADGNTILSGASGNGGDGGAWVFVRTNRTNTHDFNDDGYSDIVWRDSSGNVAFWLMNGAAALSSGGFSGAGATWSIVGQRDFNGDGMADLLWRDSSGNTVMWFMSGTTTASAAYVANIATSWTLAGVADFNGDGLGDLLWRDSSGNVAMWLMSGATVISSAALGNVPTNWTVVGTGDFNGDGMADILWQDNLGNTAIWFMNGTKVASTAGIGNIPTNWSVVGTGDFNGDGNSDIVWRDTAGDTSIWLMNGAAVLSAAALGNVPTTWSIALVGDYNGDGTSDLLWRDTAGDTAMWFMIGATIASTASVGNIPVTWTVQSVNAE
jgi:FG-GAP-like repeat/FG-GAP repeat